MRAKGHPSKDFFLDFSRLSISESTFESIVESTPLYGAPVETVTTRIERGGQLCQHKASKPSVGQRAEYS
jgi:hypothetical protein